MRVVAVLDVGAVAALYFTRHGTHDLQGAGWSHAFASFPSVIRSELPQLPLVTLRAACTLAAAEGKDGRALLLLAVGGAIALLVLAVQPGYGVATSVADGAAAPVFVAPAALPAVALAFSVQELLLAVRSAAQRREARRALGGLLQGEASDAENRLLGPCDGAKSDGGPSFMRLMRLAAPQTTFIGVGMIALAISAVSSLALPKYSGAIVDAVSNPAYTHAEKESLLKRSVLELIVISAIGGLSSCARGFIFNVVGERVTYASLMLIR